MLNKNTCFFVIIILVCLAFYQWLTNTPESHFLVKDVFSFQHPFFELDNYYLWINAATLIFPFLLSFDKKVAYYKRWKSLFPATLIVGAFFIAWDVYFTVNHVWGFNPRYLSNIEIAHLPLGEWLFFLTVPYACVFIYECLPAYIKKPPLLAFIDYIYIGVMIVMLLVTVFFWDKVYPASTSLLVLGLFIYQFYYVSKEKRAWIMLTYLISWLPFMLINGMLTGVMTQEPVVIYNPESFSNYIILSVPVDDSIYSLLLLAMNINLFDFFKEKFGNKR